MAGDLPLDGCSISLLEDGVVHLAGQKIFLGLSTNDTQVEETWIGGDGDEKPLGLTQPYVKYQELKQLFINLIDQVSNLRKDLNDHITNFNSHIHVGTSAVGPVQINPVTSQSTLTVPTFDIDSGLVSELKNDYNQLIENLKSTRIFGE